MLRIYRVTLKYSLIQQIIHLFKLLILFYSESQESKIEQIPAIILLEDGTRLEGISFGYPESVAGEVVFSTGMVGYPESLTDPSYYGQILVLTYPLIGNYGMPPLRPDDHLQNYYEAPGAQISALVVDDYSRAYSHWNASSGLAQWLYNQRVAAVSGIDTRTLTKRLREKGTMLGKIIIGDKDVDFYDPNRDNLVAKVSIDRPTVYGSGSKRVALLDCGCKHNIIREMVKRDIELLRLPWDYPLQEESFDGLLISSGPGDPKLCEPTIHEVQKTLNAGTPTFGICLGHQIMALAVGGDTEKMKYGHRSQNQPVMDTFNKQAFVTTQNHGFVVKQDSLPADWQFSFVNLNDDSSEGLCHKSDRFFSTQFHPEAAPGPTDTTFLFDRFVELL